MEWGRSTDSDPTPVDELIGRGRRVLVCDDTEQIRRLIRVNLELEGYEVVEAFDGQMALEMLQDPTRPLPDVMTVDVIMPRRDGWWTVASIRGDPRLAHIPIVMVTASAQDEDRQQARRATVDQFVTKPFEPGDLLTKIGALAAGGRIRDDVEFRLHDPIAVDGTPATGSAGERQQREPT